MPVTATDEVALALDHLRHSVAASAAFQAWTGTVDEASALPRVYAGEAPDGTAFPMAVAWLQRWGNSRIATGAGDEFESIGTLILQLTAEIEATDRSDAYLSMLNRVGAITAEILARSGSADPYLACESLNVRSVYRFEETSVAARGSDIWMAFIEIQVRP